MKRLSNALLLAALLACGSPALAQRDQKSNNEPADVCATELTREKLDNPPERTTKFDVMEEPLKMRLHDVKAVDQKYVALVWIELPADQRGPGGRTVDGLRDKERFGKISNLQMLRRPSEEEIRFFTSADINRVLLDDTSRRETYRAFRILAKSPEEAQRRVETLMSFLDQGLTRPIQLALFEQREEHCQAIQQAEKEAPAAEAMATTIGKELERYADFTLEMLPELRVQQLQLEVELAGVKARLSTCEKLLNGKISDERRKQVEDVKIAAEIELAGFEARQSKSAEFVAKVKSKHELISQQGLVLGKLQAARQRLSRSIQSVTAIDREIPAFGPVELYDGRVAIHPIEWTR